MFCLKLKNLTTNWALEKFYYKRFDNWGLTCGNLKSTVTRNCVALRMAPLRASENSGNSTLIQSVPPIISFLRVIFHRNRLPNFPDAKESGPRERLTIDLSVNSHVSYWGDKMDAQNPSSVNDLPWGVCWWLSNVMNF